MRWWLLRNYILEVGIYLLFLLARALNEQFYLRYKRPVLPAFFDRPPSRGVGVLHRWAGSASRGCWRLAGQVFPFPQLDRARLRALTFSLMLATFLKNRFYAMNEDRRYRTFCAAEAVVLCAFVCAVYFAVRLLFRGTSIDALQALLCALSIALCLRLLSRAAKTE